MTSITKTKPGSSIPIEFRSQTKVRYGQSETRSSVDRYVTTGSSTIIYQSGPKYLSGRCNWKECSQSNNGSHTGFVGRLDVDGTLPYGAGTMEYSWTGGIGLKGYCPPLPSVPYPYQELCDLLWNKIDLNTSDAVLAYSGVIQLVPLLGGLAKGLQILNRIGRWATKSLRRRPFSEVLKLAIQADFIDRFVISPTLDDLQKVQQSCDYVLNIINEVHERNSAPTALRVSLPTTTSSSSGSGTISGRDLFNYSDGRFSMSYDWKASAGSDASLFLLADLYYDYQSLDPISIWAQRTGLSRPLDSAWDLVPFSFVVDYFTRCGDFISHLSDQMSKVEGLCGKIAKVYSCWSTNKMYAKASAFGTSYSAWTNYWNYEIKHKSFQPGHEEFSYTSFSRYEMNNKILEMSGFWDKGGLIHPNLSLTRARTIAELVIQAKL